MFVAIFGFLETDKVNNYLLLVQSARAHTGTNLRGNKRWITPIYIDGISSMVVYRHDLITRQDSHLCYPRQTFLIPIP